MASNGIYAVERGKDAVAVMGSSVIDISSDPAAGGFFTNDFKKNERLKAMLDSNKDGLKLEAMKLIIGMVAKGRDASDLFPAVVKNVVSKNIEVKKLVYVYLVRYAEEQQDLALLSISTFQRALKDPNQLIRASALRVLSSIRVPVIVPIMMLAIKDAVNDMSPYVRKTAAHAIPKLYSLDPEQKDQLIEVIEKLLSDKTTLVVGSAAMAFEEVCPERMDLLHKNYRKLCTLLVDVEEWGQTVILGMLTRYARTQFLDPNQNNKKNDEEEPNKTPNNDDEEESDGVCKEEMNLPKQLDPDHRLLLRNCKPLLQSRNAAVVMAVAKIFVYLAPADEINIVAKALIRLIHSHREIQSIVLSNIVTLTQMKKSMFSPYLKSFFVRSSDPTHIKLLKLDILTNLASPPNVSIILKEFQTYISCSDMKFVAATIQAIGTCACSIKDVSDTCLNGLVSLLSNRNETIVAESVVVIKKLLQMQPLEHKDIIKHMARLFENLAVPMAKASILWLVGEYSEQVPRRAPDVLRKAAKTFASEEPIVKLQALNLAAKLLLTNPQQTRLLVQYVFNLAKYDQNYDIRDRARFLRHLLLDNSAGPLTKYAKKIILAPKPAPVLTRDKVADQGHFQLGSLSHYLRTRAHGYQELPDFPSEAPDPSVRNVPEALPTTTSSWNSENLGFYRKGGSQSGSTGRSSFNIDGYEGGNQLLSPGQTSFYSDEEKSDEESSSASEDLDEDEDAESDGSGRKSPHSIETEEESTEEESSAEESDSGSTDSSESSIEKLRIKKKLPPSTKKETTKPSQDLLLLDLDFTEPQGQQSTTGPAVTQVPLVPLAATASTLVPSVNFVPQVVPAKYVPSQHQTLLSRPGGLTVSFRFTRTPNIYSNMLTNIELQFQNNGTQPIEGIQVENTEQSGISVRGFPALGTLMPGGTFTAAIGVDYNESTQPAKFAITADGQIHPVTLKAPVGELIRPLVLSDTEFLREQAKLRGLTENTVMVELAPPFKDTSSLTNKVYETANVMEVTTLETNILRFAGHTLTSNSLVLITLRPQFPKTSITINCEKMIIGSMLLKELKDALMAS